MYCCSSLSVKTLILQICVPIRNLKTFNFFLLPKIIETLTNAKFCFKTSYIKKELVVEKN